MKLDFLINLLQQKYPYSTASLLADAYEDMVDGLLSDEIWEHLSKYLEKHQENPLAE